MKIYKPKGSPKNKEENKDGIENKETNQEVNKGAQEVPEVASPIIVTDHHGTVTYANESFCQISKYNLEELLLQKYCVFNPAFQPEELVQELWRKIGHGKIWRGRLRNMAKDGSFFWLESMVIPNLNDKGDPYQYVVLRSDTIPRKASEVQLLSPARQELTGKEKDQQATRLIRTLSELLSTGAEHEKFIAELFYENEELAVFPGDNENDKAELAVSVNEPAYKNRKKVKRATEILVANKELAIQNSSKRNTGSDLVLSNQEHSFERGENENRGDSFQGGKEFVYSSLEKERRSPDLQLTIKGRGYPAEDQPHRSGELSDALKRVVALASIADNLQEPIVAVDQHFCITRWNRPAENILEWKADEVIGKNLEQILRLEFREAGLEDINRDIKENNSWQGEAISYSKSGKMLNMLATASPIKDNEGRVTGNLFLLHDITQRIKSETLFRGLFEHMMHGFAYCKAILEDAQLTDYIYLEVNSEYENLIGTAHIAGKKASEVLPGWMTKDPELVQHLTHVAMTGESVKFEYYFTQIAKWVSFSIYSMEKGSFVILMDSIAERKLVEERMQNLNNELEEKVKKRTEELEAFSYSVSHDLRSPLRAIDGYAQMLKEDYAPVLDGEGNRFLDTVQRNANKMGSLIDDLLAFSRLSRKEISKSNINMTALVQSVRDELSKAVPHKAEIKINTLLPVTADYALMSEVVTNLLSNAIKYSFSVEHPVIEVSSRQNGAYVVYAVKDNGTGFDMQYVHKLYGVFQRLHSSEEFEGTGVGLAIVKRIIEKQGGSVWAEGKPGEGAVFYFSLPAPENK